MVVAACSPLERIGLLRGPSTRLVGVDAAGRQRAALVHRADLGQHAVATGPIQTADSAIERDPRSELVFRLELAGLARSHLRERCGLGHVLGASQRLSDIDAGSDRTLLCRSIRNTVAHNRVLEAGEHRPVLLPVRDVLDHTHLEQVGRALGRPVLAGQLALENARLAQVRSVRPAEAGVRILEGLARVDCVEGIAERDVFEVRNGVDALGRQGRVDLCRPEVQASGSECLAVKCNVDLVRRRLGGGGERGGDRGEAEGAQELEGHLGWREGREGRSRAGGR